MTDREFRLRVRIDELRDDLDYWRKEGLKGRWARGHAKKFRLQRDEAVKELKAARREIVRLEKKYERFEYRMLKVPA